MNEMFSDQEQGARLVRYESSHSTSPSNETLESDKLSREQERSSMCHHDHDPGNPDVPNFPSNDNMSIFASVNCIASYVQGPASLQMMDCQNKRFKEGVNAGEDIGRGSRWHCGRS